MSSLLPGTMLAASYPVSGPESGTITVDRISRPYPGPGEVLVAVSVSGVNPTDWKARWNHSSEGPAWQIPNQDGAGKIVAVGKGVDDERLGERVWLWQSAWQRTSGTAAEYVAVPEAQAVPLPPQVSFDLGAGLGIPAMTAYHCLFAAGPLVETDQVLVHGGAGAVGHAAIELACHSGSRVAATISGPEKAALAAAAGAEVVIDYRREDVAERVRQWAPNGVARIVEVDLARNLGADAAVVAPGGSISVYARTEQAITPAWELMLANASINFILVYTISDAAKRAAVDGVTAALRDKALTSMPVIRFPLAETAAAHDAVREGAVGKVLIDINPGQVSEPPVE